MDKMKKLMTAVLIVVLSVTLVGCMKVSGEEVKETEETAEQAVTNILEAIQTVNIETLDKYEATILIGAKDEDNTKRNLAIFENLEYTILEVTKTEETKPSNNQKDDTETEGTEKGVIAKVEIKNKDLTPVVEKYVENSKNLNIENESLGEAKLSEDEIIKKNSDMLIDLVNKEEYIEFKNTVDVKLIKDVEGWKIKPDYSLQNAIYGNIPKAQSEVDWGDGNTSDENMDEVAREIDKAINGKIKDKDVRYANIAVVGEN